MSFCAECKTDSVRILLRRLLVCVKLCTVYMHTSEPVDCTKLLHQCQIKSKVKVNGFLFHNLNMPCVLKGTFLLPIVFKVKQDICFNCTSVLFLSLCAAFSFYTCTLQKGIPFVEVAVCWFVGDVVRGGGALAGSRLGTVVCYLSGNFCSGMIQPGPTAASLGGLLQWEKASQPERKWVVVTSPALLGSELAFPLKKTCVLSDLSLYSLSFVIA